MNNLVFIGIVILLVLVSCVFLFFSDSFIKQKDGFENEIKIFNCEKKIRLLDLINDNDELYGIIFYPSNISITIYKNNYLIALRYINYDIENNIIPKNNISINKFLTLNTNFQLINTETIIPNELIINNISNNIIGIEDIKIFNDNNFLKIIGTTQNANNDIGIITGIYDYDTNTIKNKYFIKNTFNFQNIEKNWVYFKNNNDVNIIYKWYPLQICEIKNDKLYLLEEKLMPSFFKNARGSTCGIKYNNEIWFIIHFNEYSNYYHSIVIFDESMKLKMYSEKFKFENYKIEFCLGFLINENKFIISYTLNDKNPTIGVYDINDIIKLKWTYNNR